MLPSLLNPKPRTLTPKTKRGSEGPLPLSSQSVLQATMVATWLLELYMDQINRALLDEPAAPPEGSGAASEPVTPVAQENGMPAGTSLSLVLST